MRPDNVKPDERRRTAALAVISAALGLAMVTVQVFCRVPTAEQGLPLTGLVQTGVDPNEAEWFEIAQLPGIGETLARRIVEFRREAAQKPSASLPSFKKAADLSSVKGLGRAAIKRLRPFLRFNTSV